MTALVDPTTTFFTDLSWPENHCPLCGHAGVTIQPREYTSRIWALCGHAAMLTGTVLRVSSQIDYENLLEVEVGLNIIVSETYIFTISRVSSFVVVHDCFGFIVIFIEVCLTAIGPI